MGEGVSERRREDEWERERVRDGGRMSGRGSE